MLSKGTAYEKAELFFDLIDYECTRSMEKEEFAALVGSMMEISIDSLPNLAVGTEKDQVSVLEMEQYAGVL